LRRDIYRLKLTTLNSEISGSAVNDFSQSFTAEPHLLQNCGRA